MPQIIPIPAFADNYIWLLRDGAVAAVVDPGDAAPVIAYLERAGLALYRHPRDPPPRRPRRRHPGAARRVAQVPVFGPARETIPGRTQALAGGDRIDVPGIDATLRRHRRAGPHGRPHRALRRVRRRAVALLRRHALRRRLRAPVRRARRHRCGRRCRRSPRCRPRRAFIAGTNTRSRTFASHWRSNPAMRDLKARRRARTGEARSRRADGAVDDGRGARHQSVPARASAGGQGCGGGARRATAGRRRRVVRARCGSGKTTSNRLDGLIATPGAGAGLPSPEFWQRRRAIVAGRPTGNRIARNHSSDPCSLPPRWPPARRPLLPPHPGTATRRSPSRRHRNRCRVPDPPMPPLLTDPFPAAAGAELEPLPAPAPDLWERIVAGYAIPDIEGPLVEKWEQLVRAIAPTTWRGWSSAAAATCITSSPRSRRAECPRRSRCCRWSRARSTRSRCRRAARRASGSSSRRRASTTVSSRISGWIRAATCWPRPTRRSTYLDKLHGDFDDWQLALAGYNWGEGNVAKAVARNKAKGLPTNYQSLPMPAETAQLPAQAAGDQEHRPRPGEIRAGAGRHPRCAVLRRGQDDAQDGHEVRRRTGGNVARGFPGAQPAAQPAGDRRRRRAVDPAADRQRRDLRRQARAHQPADWCRGRRTGCSPTRRCRRSRPKYGMSVETLRAVNGIGRARASACRPHAAGAGAERVDGSGGVAVAGRVHDGSVGPHVLLHGEARRHAER